MMLTQNRLYCSERGRRLGVLALLAVAASACSEETSAPLASDELQNMQADQVIFGMTGFLTAGGVKEGRVQADTAFMFADSTVAQLRQMEIVFYDEEGHETATVTGNRGRWAPETDVMIAWGDVVLTIHSDSSRIESQEIHYDPALERVWSDSATVRIEHDGTTTSGTSFESDMTFENFIIENPRGGARRVTS